MAHPQQMKSSFALFIRYFNRIKGGKKRSWKRAALIYTGSPGGKRDFIFIAGSHGL